jgi:dTDP-4-dehydrorhamnose reductase
MPSILVTGPRGLLGSTLLRVLKDAGMTAHAYDGDIADARALGAFVSALPSVDVIVHTAAATDVNRCEKEPEWCTRVNVDGTQNVRDAAASRNARLIFISTVSVFSGMEGNYREDDRPDPRNHYNVSKRRGEEIVLAYDKSLVLRVNLIGIHPDGSRGKNFMEWLVDTVRANKDMKLFTDVRINPLSPWTLAEMITKLITVWPERKILHLGSRTVLSKADIGRLVVAFFPSYQGHVEYTSIDALSTSAFRPKEMWLNVDAARDAVGQEMPTLEEEVERIHTHL